MDYENDLIEWTIRFVKHRDLIKKNLIDYKILKNFIEFEFKDKKHIYYIYPELNDGSIKELNDELISFIVLNKKSNVKFLADNWDKFIKFQKTNIVFVNSKVNQHWIITPFIHNKIAEKKKLKKGLMSLFDNVTSI